MRQFKPTKGLKYRKSLTKNQKQRRRLQKETAIELERKPRIKRNGILIN
jgi:hypothetical protein